MTHVPGGKQPSWDPQEYPPQAHGQQYSQDQPWQQQRYDSYANQQRISAAQEQQTQPQYGQQYPQEQPLHLTDGAWKRHTKLNSKHIATALVLSGVALVVTVGGLFRLDQAVRHASSQSQASISHLQTELNAAEGKLSAMKADTDSGTSKFGICYQTDTQSFSGLVDSIMDNYSFVVGVDIGTPNDVNGVVSCASGYTYVPVVPGNNSTNSN
jgi:hypothetical protein